MFVLLQSFHNTLNACHKSINGAYTNTKKALRKKLIIWIVQNRDRDNEK